MVAHICSIDLQGNVTISNDGATIMKKLEIVHPAAKVLVDISLSQDAEVGGKALLQGAISKVSGHSAAGSVVVQFVPLDGILGSTGACCLLQLRQAEAPTQLRGSSSS